MTTRPRAPAEGGGGDEAAVQGHGQVMVGERVGLELSQLAALVNGRRGGQEAGQQRRRASRSVRCRQQKMQAHPS